MRVDGSGAKLVGRAKLETDGRSMSLHRIGVEERYSGPDVNPGYPSWIWANGSGRMRQTKLYASSSAVRGFQKVVFLLLIWMLLIRMGAEVILSEMVCQNDAFNLQLTFFLCPCGVDLTRLRLLITSVFRLIGRGRPWSLRKRPQALHSTDPTSSLRHNGVVEVWQF